LKVLRKQLLRQQEEQEQQQLVRLVLPWSLFCNIYDNGMLLPYITDLVCDTNFHWLFNHECQHIFGKQTGYIFQSPKTITTWTTKITLHWINRIIRNNKCIFTKLNAVFKL
jgi:hypothetical protein